MSNIQTGAERMPHELSYLGFLAGKIGRRITMSTTAVISGDSCEMDAVGAFFFSSRRRHPGLQGDWSSDVCSSDLASGVESALAGASADAASLAAAAGHAAEGTNPPSDTNGSTEYRTELAKVLVRRALEEATAG